MIDLGRISRFAVLVSIFALTAFAPQAAAELPSPKDHFGFMPGDDGRLMDYDELIAYLRLADKASDRLELRAVGESPMGREMYVLFASSPDNLARLGADPVQIGRRHRAGPDQDPRGDLAPVERPSPHVPEV